MNNKERKEWRNLAAAQGIDEITFAAGRARDISESAELIKEHLLRMALPELAKNPAWEILMHDTARDFQPSGYISAWLDEMERDIENLRKFFRGEKVLEG